MRRRIALGAALFALIAYACFPPPLDETGKSCTALTGCGEGYECDVVATLKCYPLGQLPEDAGEGDNDAGDYDGGFNTDDDGGVPFMKNLLRNPDFEVLLPGPQVPLRPDAWTTGAGDLTTETRYSHSGTRSARNAWVSGSGIFGIAPTVPPVLDAPQGARFCASVFVRGADGGPSTRLTIRELDSKRFPYVTSTTTTIVLNPKWQELSLAHTASGRYKYLDVRMYSSGGSTGDYTLYDDAALWRTDGGCETRPFN